jgi:hypothetical protein
VESGVANPDLGFFLWDPDPPFCRHRIWILDKDPDSVLDETKLHITGRKWYIFLNI